MEKDLKNNLTTTPDDSHNPKDTIAAIAWHPSSSETPFFSCSSWDSKLYFYFLNDDGYLNLLESVSLPSIATNLKWENNSIYYGSPDGTVNIFDIEKETSIKIGKHSDIVLRATPTPISNNSVISVSGDGQFYLWDIRDKKMAYDYKIANKQKIFSANFDETSSIVAYTQLGLMTVINLKGLFSSPNSIQCGQCHDETINSRSISIQGSKVAVGTTHGDFYYFTFNKNGPLDISHLHSTSMKRGLMTKNFIPSNISCLDIHPKTENVFQIGGNRLLIYSGHVGMITNSWEMDSNITACKYSPDGKYTAFATGNDYSLGQYEKVKHVPEIFLYGVSSE